MPCNIEHPRARDLDRISQILDYIPTITDLVLAMAMAKDFEELIPLAERVIGQTTRRVIHDEKVPATEKIVSIFEPHTDIIKKDRRETFYGTKYV